MTATNHVLAGALIGAALPLPIAIPVAFVSHFVLDAIPHYGIEGKKRNSSRIYKAIVTADIIVALSIGAAAAYFNQWAMLLCGFVAYFPDATLVYSYLRNGRDLNISSENESTFFKFHLGIQTEKPWGIFIELALMIPMMAIFINQVSS